MPRSPVHSWPHTLTVWCVIRAFERAGCPGCLRKPPALAAAFVGEVSKAVRFRTFSLREAELPVLLEAAAESACELAGGDAYRAVRAAATDAEHEYHHSITRTGHCPQRYARHERCSTAVATQRHQFQAEINSAQCRFVRAYWAEQRQHWLRSDPFAHLRREHPIQRIAAFTPVWWELFLRCLHSEFSRRDFAQFHLLDALPQLRRQTRPKKVLAALVEEWRQRHADELGLPAQLHYHVLARRGQIRARATAGWFNTRAPGYTSDFTVADAARSYLIEHTAGLPVPPADCALN